ncbi:hypothetical protein ORV05_28955 [Amycolatopsis cynarae]|uniref:Uncharacterized protein n=1 Tax=Amycolatopsis cynarae TaxID=2995223 RepID=A0ABY7AYY5_9PSEU|nr:hypothetical protein [Amycolatopsis sp. HUAS 11-8]WAL64925.1 hypothetical protein ORV05_28955 [Amycolatopsis sp. HUAS 11-8]
MTHLSRLVLWARTLDEATVRWWPTRYGDLHISIQGRAGGLVMHVYGGIAFRDCDGLISLDTDERQDVTLNELTALRDLLQSREVTA